MRVLTAAGLALLSVGTAVVAQTNPTRVPSQGAFGCTTVFDGVRFGQLLTVPASSCASLAGNVSDLLSSCASDGVLVALTCGDDTGNTSLRSLRLNVDFSVFPDPVAQADLYVMTTTVQHDVLASQVVRLNADCEQSTLTTVGILF